MKRAELLRIDVASEIRSLCDAQLRGTWQMPAELVRFAIGCGANRVSVGSRRRGFSISWRDGTICGETLADLVSALDDTAAVDTRQRSIARLEAAGADPLLWAGGVAGARLRIESADADRLLRCEIRDRRAPRLACESDPPSPPGVEIRWGCGRLDRRRAALWLRMACRFAGIEVSLDGQHIGQGFAGGLFRLEIEDPVPATIGLTRHADEPVLWLMRGGVVGARAVLPGYPAFEAAIELGDEVSGGGGSADLRSAVTPYLGEISDRAVWMMIQVVGRPDAVTGPDGQRLIELALMAVRSGLREAEIRKLPLLPTVAGGRHLLSMDEAAELARRRGGRLFAVAPGGKVTNLMVDPRTVLVISPQVRKLLAEVLGLSLQSPPQRRDGMFRRCVEFVRGVAGRGVERLRGFAGGPALPVDALSAGERRLLALLRAELAPRSCDLGRGRRVRRTGRGLILPRADPMVAAIADLVAVDPAWLYPLLVALRIDDPASASLQERWKRLMSEETERRI